MKPGDLKETAIPEELIRCYEEHSTDENGKESIRKISLMYRREVPQFRTAFFSSCIRLYNYWHLFNQAPPGGNGWANERAVTCEILEILERESRDYDAWEREKEYARRGIRN